MKLMEVFPCRKKSKPFNALKWCKHQDPDTVPFRPGAAHTQGFGLRISMPPILVGAFPGHLGNDRGTHPVAIYMPFDGMERWVKVGGVAGSLLQLIPEGDVPIEMQVFHTIRTDGTIQPFERQKEKGSRLSVKAGALGLSFGAHTHSEIVTASNDYILEKIKAQDGNWIYSHGKFNDDFIAQHCEKYGMDYKIVAQKLKEQVQSWTIDELWETWAVRRAMPEYRTPHWGAGPTLHLSTQEYLQI